MMFIKISVSQIHAVHMIQYDLQVSPRIIYDTVSTGNYLYHGNFAGFFGQNSASITEHRVLLEHQNGHEM